MRVQDVYNVIYTHTEGEPLCIICCRALRANSAVAKFVFRFFITASF
jgi:hypothetical protein